MRISSLVAGAIAALIIAAPCHIACAQEMAAPGATATPSGRMMMPEPLLVTVQAVPGYGPAPLLVGFLIHATDPSGARITSFKWNFGDGHTSVAPPLMAYNNYSRAGNYVASVTITTADGRSATGFAGVIVKPSLSAGSQQRQQNQ